MVVVVVVIAAVVVQVCGRRRSVTRIVEQFILDNVAEG